MKKEDNTVSRRRNDYEKIKTYEDACAYLGVKERDFTGVEKDEIAYAKIKTIAKALNDGWEADFTNGNQKKFWPLFFLYTQPEWENISEEVRKSGVFFGGNANNGAYCGFLYESTNSAPSYAYAYIGSQLCYKSAELAKYAGKQFVDIYFDFVIGGYND